MARVASIGECMIELSQATGGLLARSYGGDTLNTAVYLAPSAARGWRRRTTSAPATGQRLPRVRSVL
jgi:hypothetical protein